MRRRSRWKIGTKTLGFWDLLAVKSRTGFCRNSFVFLNAPLARRSPSILKHGVDLTLRAPDAQALCSLRPTGLCDP